MRTKVFLLTVFIQASLSKSVPNLFREPRTVKEAVQIGVGVVGVAADGVANVVDLAADIADTLAQKGDLAVTVTKDVTELTSDTILELFDLKIEFILCNIFRVCPLRDVEVVLGRSSMTDDDMPTEAIKELNAAILAESTDEVVKSGRLLFAYQNQEEYIKQKIEELLCRYNSVVYCRPQAVGLARNGDVIEDVVDAVEAPMDEAPVAVPEDILVETPEENDAAVQAIEPEADTAELDGRQLVDPVDTPMFIPALELPTEEDIVEPAVVPVVEKATLTKSLVVRKFFTHLSVKLGFVLCNLRVWCPDENLAFQ